MADDLYVIEVLVAELDVVGGDVVGGDVVELLVAEVDVVGWGVVGWGVVDVVVDEEMELVVYDHYRMICFLTLLWICKICIFISSTLSIRPLKYTVNTYIYYTYTYKIEWLFCLYLCKNQCLITVLTALLHGERSLELAYAQNW